MINIAKEKLNYDFIKKFSTTYGKYSFVDEMSIISSKLVKGETVSTLDHTWLDIYQVLVEDFCTKEMDMLDPNSEDYKKFKQAKQAILRVINICYL